MVINKRQRCATLAFLKIDRRHGDPPSRAQDWLAAAVVDVLYLLDPGIAQLAIYMYKFPYWEG